MEMVKNILYIIYAIICVAIIIITLVQKSENEAGPSEAITGSTTNNFYDKNKGRTGEGLLKRWTIILGIIFALLTLALSVLTLV